MKIENRIRALEAALLTDPVILYFADGSMRELAGGGYHIYELFIDFLQGTLSPERKEQVEWIRLCTSSLQPGGGHMVDLLRCMLHGPVGPETSRIESSPDDFRITAEMTGQGAKFARKKEKDSYDSDAATD